MKLKNNRILYIMCSVLFLSPTHCVGTTYRLASFELFKSPNVDSYIGLARGNSELCLKKILGGNDEGIESLIKAWERSLRGGFLEVEKHFFQEHGSILELCAENNSPMANDVCAAIKEIEAHFSKIRNDVSAALSADVSSSLKDLQKKGDYSKLSSLIDLERRLKIELNRCYREALEKHLIAYNYHASDSKVELINSKVNSLFQKSIDGMDGVLTLFNEIDTMGEEGKKVLFHLFTKQPKDQNMLQDMLEAKLEVDKNTIDLNKLKMKAGYANQFYNTLSTNLFEKKQQLVNLTLQLKSLEDQLNQEDQKDQEGVKQQMEELEAGLARELERNNLIEKATGEVSKYLKFFEKELEKIRKERKRLLKDLANKEKEMLSRREAIKKERIREGGQIDEYEYDEGHEINLRFEENPLPQHQEMDLELDLTSIMRVAEEYLATPTPNLKKEWLNKVGAIFLNDFKRFNEKARKRWNSYDENEPLDALEETETSVNEIREVRNKLLEYNKNSILNKLKEVKQEYRNTKNTTRRRKELEGEVNKVYECLRFDNFRIDKGDEIYLERQKFRFKAGKILKADSIGDKRKKLGEAYKEAERKVNTIIEEVEQAAERVRKSTGFNDAVDDSMDKFGSYINDEKKWLKSLRDEVMKKEKEKERGEKKQSLNSNPTTSIQEQFQLPQNLCEKMQTLSNGISGLSLINSPGSLQVWNTNVRSLLDNFINENSNEIGIDEVKEKLEGFIKQLKEDKKNTDHFGIFAIKQGILEYLKASFEASPNQPSESNPQFPSISNPNSPSTNPNPPFSLPPFSPLSNSNPSSELLDQESEYLSELTNIKPIAEDYLANPTPNLKKRWTAGVNSIFLNKRGVFNKEVRKKWNLYNENETLEERLGETEVSVNEIHKERNNALNEVKTSILNILKNVKREGTEDATQRSKELEDEVDKVYKFYGFDNFSIDKGDEIFAEKERFRFKVRMILEDDTKDKRQELTEAYGIAEGNIDTIVEEVKQEAERVKTSTGLGNAMNNFGFGVAEDKYMLKKLRDEALQCLGQMEKQKQLSSNPDPFALPPSFSPQSDQNPQFPTSPSNQPSFPNMPSPLNQPSFSDPISNQPQSPLNPTGQPGAPSQSNPDLLSTALFDNPIQEVESNPSSEPSDQAPEYLSELTSIEPMAREYLAVPNEELKKRWSEELDSIFLNKSKEFKSRIDEELDSCNVNETLERLEETERSINEIREGRNEVLEKIRVSILDKLNDVKVEKTETETKDTAQRSKELEEEVGESYKFYHFDNYRLDKWDEISLERQKFRFKAKEILNDNNIENKREKLTEGYRIAEWRINSIVEEVRRVTEMENSTDVDDLMTGFELGSAEDRDKLKSLRDEAMKQVEEKKQLKVDIISPSNPTEQSATNPPFSNLFPSQFESKPSQQSEFQNPQSSSNSPLFPPNPPPSNLNLTTSTQPSFPTLSNPQFPSESNQNQPSTSSNLNPPSPLNPNLDQSTKNPSPSFSDPTEQSPSFSLPPSSNPTPQKQEMDLELDLTSIEPSESEKAESNLNPPSTNLIEQSDPSSSSTSLNQPPFSTSEFWLEEDVPNQAPESPLDLTSIELMAQEYLTTIESNNDLPELRFRWFNEVGNIFFNKSKVFIDRIGAKWGSYDKNKTLEERLGERETSVNEIREERNNALNEVKTSILSILENIKQEGTEDATQNKRKELEDEVNRAYDYCCFDNFRIDKRYEICVKRQKFMLEATKIFDDSIEDKEQELNKAYEEAQRKIDSIVEEVKQTAEGVKTSTGMNKAVDDSMNMLGPVVDSEKEQLKEDLNTALQRLNKSPDSSDPSISSSNHPNPLQSSLDQNQFPPFSPSSTSFLSSNPTSSTHEQPLGGGDSNPPPQHSSSPLNQFPSSDSPISSPNQSQFPSSTNLNPNPIPQQQSIPSNSPGLTDLTNIEQMAEKYLTTPTDNLKKKWSAEVGSIFFNKSKVFNKKVEEQWTSYGRNKNKTLEVLKETKTSFNEIREERDKVIESTRDSILNKLNSVKQEGTRNDTRSRKDLKDEVDRVYEFYCFDNFRVDKGYEIYFEKERFRFETEKILKDDIGDKGKELNKAYEEAKGNIDNIVKEVKEKAEEVKASTGMNKDVDDSMNKFGSYVYNGKNLLKEIWDKAKKLQEKQQLEKQQLEKQQLEKQQLEKQQLEKQQLEKPPSQLSETERFNRWIAFLKEDLEVVYSIIGGFKLEASLNNVKNLESMTLPDKKNWEASVIRDILIAFNDVMKKLDELIIQPNLPLTEKLQYLGVKATFYINKANWVGIKEKVCNLRWKIEVATKGNNLEEGYNRLNDELEALKKEIEERNKCCYSLKCLNDEIWKWINEVKDVNNLPEKEALRSLSENVLEAKKAIERGEDLPKLETFKGEFNKIKESNSLEGIKEKFDLLNELDGFLKSLNDIVDSFKSGERIKLEQEIKEINKKKNEKSFKNEVGNLRSRVKKFKDEAMEFEKKPLQQLNKCLPLLKKDWMFVLDLLNIRNGKLRDKLLDALARFDKIESEALKWKREFVQDVSVILLDVFEAAVERLNGLIQATSSPIEKLKYLGVKAILHIYNANKVGITEKVYELREKIEGSSSEEDYNRLNGELEKLMTEVEVRDKCWHSFSDLHYSIDFLEGGRWVRKSNAVIAFDRTVTNAVASIEAGDELPKLEEFQARFDELQQKK